MTTRTGPTKARWDPETDPSRPKIGAIVSRNGIEYVVGKVRAFSPATFLIEGKGPNKEGYDELIVEKHPTQFWIHWLIWAKRA